MPKIALLALAAVLTVVALAGAKSPGTSDTPGKEARPAGPAVAACKTERAADPAAFEAKYANEKGKRAGRRCVRQHVKAARKGCRAERATDKAAFRAKYAGPKGGRAMKRCVRQHAGDPVS